jgi:hypothetical protein
MKPIDLTEAINGIQYFSVKNFALATGKSEQSIRFLITNGNRLRSLKADRIADKPMIPYSELLEFPFTLAGRNSEEVYYYDENGQQQPNVVCLSLK